MRRGREKTDVRGVTAIDVGMRHTAEHREILAIFLQELEVRRRRVAHAAVLRKKQIGPKAEIVADAEHPPRLGSRRKRRGRFRGARERWQHRVEKGQRKRDARAPEKMSARHRTTRDDEGSGVWF